MEEAGGIIMARSTGLPKGWIRNTREFNQKLERDRKKYEKEKYKETNMDRCKRR